LSDSAQAVLGGKIITLNVYIDATQPTMRWDCIPINPS
jgi:hypothetical protein